LLLLGVDGQSREHHFAVQVLDFWEFLAEIVEKAFDQDNLVSSSPVESLLCRYFKSDYALALEQIKLQAADGLLPAKDQLEEVRVKVGVHLYLAEAVSGTEVKAVLGVHDFA